MKMLARSSIVPWLFCLSICAFPQTEKVENFRVDARLALEGLKNALPTRSDAPEISYADDFKGNEQACGKYAFDELRGALTQKSFTEVMKLYPVIVLEGTAKAMGLLAKAGIGSDVAGKVTEAAAKIGRIALEADDLQEFTEKVTQLVGEEAAKRIAKEYGGKGFDKLYAYFLPGQRQTRNTKATGNYCKLNLEFAAGRPGAGSGNKPRLHVQVTTTADCNRRPQPDPEKASPRQFTIIANSTLGVEPAQNAFAYQITGTTWEVTGKCGGFEEKKVEEKKDPNRDLWTLKGPKLDASCDLDTCQSASEHLQPQVVEIAIKNADQTIRRVKVTTQPTAHLFNGSDGKRTIAIWWGPNTHDVGLADHSKDASQVGEELDSPGAGTIIPHAFHDSTSVKAAFDKGFAVSKYRDIYGASIEVPPEATKLEKLILVISNHEVTWTAKGKPGRTFR